RDIIEQAMYLPMLIAVLERDRQLFDKSGFKIKEPYLNLMEETLNAVQRDLKIVKDRMRQENMKVEQIGHDETFTMYSFFWKGYVEHHNYFNPRIRNKVQELLEYYLGM